MQQLRSFLALYSVVCFLPALEAQTTPPAPPLPGKGMAQHPFLYCGEWQRGSTSEQVMYIVRGGKIVWSYTNPQKGELGDCTMLSNGNIVFSRQFGASEINPDQEIVWNYDGPAGTEIHSAYPIDKDRVLIMQNGNPAKLLVINKKSSRVEKELTLATRAPASAHGQFRHVRMTRAGTFLVAHMDLGRVVEYDQDGRDIWSVPAPSAWAAVRLKNGNTLITDEKDELTLEVNQAKDTVWQLRPSDLPEKYRFRGTQSCTRLVNGNTIICSRGGGGKGPQLVEVTPDKKVLWVLWDFNHLGPATALQILDDPGYPEIPGESEH